MVAPSAHFAPAIEHGNLFNAIRRCALNVIIKRAEFIANALDIINKFGEFKCQFKIAAVADALNGASEDCTPCRYPVYLCLVNRVAALVENIREEIRQESALGVFNIFDIAE